MPQNKGFRDVFQLKFHRKIFILELDKFGFQVEQFPIFSSILPKIVLIFISFRAIFYQIPCYIFSKSNTEIRKKQHEIE